MSIAKMSVSEQDLMRERGVKHLLQHLDFLRPLLLDDYSLVRVALARFEFFQSKVRPPDPPLSLGTYEMSIQEARKFFPTENPSFERLLVMMSTNTRVLGSRVVLYSVLGIISPKPLKRLICGLALGGSLDNILARSRSSMAHQVFCPESIRYSGGWAKNTNPSSINGRIYR